MKKAISRIIIVLIIVNLITAGFTLAQDVIEEENQEVLSMQTQEEAIAQRNAEVAEKAAERQAIIAQEKMKAAEKQMKAAVVKQKDIERKMKDLMLNIRIPDVNLPHLPHLSHLQQSGSGGGILVIPSAEMKVENLAAITEDMSIMSRIFDKQLSQSKEPNARGRMYGDFNLFFGRGNRTTEAIYLEGYGALFLMNVNMPLSAPPEAQQQKEKAEEDTDPVWAQMRREMYEPEGIRRSRGKERPEEKYDAEKVETIKTNLIKTLKHATNIHALKPDQLVILTVIGNKHGSAATVTQSISYGRSGRTRGSSSSTGRRRTVQTTPEGETNSLLPTVLTICAKKSDIDAFAAGELDYDQFRQRTGIFKSYAKAGQQDSPVAHEHEVAHEEHQTAYGDHTAF
jgi:hypothetical protein